MKSPRNKAIDRANANMRKSKSSRKIFYHRYFEVTEPEFMDAVRYLNSIKPINESAYRKNLKKMADRVRKKLNETCMIGFVFAKRTEDDLEVLLVILFDGVEATDDNFGSILFDEKLNRPYMLLK